MVQPNRTFSANQSYRYGFNGKENDNEVKGEGNQQDYGMRIYDPRLVRFLSTDPISKSYPQLTPYQFASNRSIDGVDLDGLEYFKSEGKNMKSLYGLTKFNADDKAYTMGNIAIRNSEVHQIIENHPRSTATKENPADDDSAPEVKVVEPRRQDSKKQVWKQKQDVKNANLQMAPDILGGLIGLVQWTKEAAYDIKYSSEISYASNSIHALAKADDLVRAASKSVTFPDKLNRTAQLTDLVNYVMDFTLPADADEKYINLIKTWGTLLLNYQSSVLAGTFDFSPISNQYTTVTRTTNASDGLQYKYIIVNKVGNDNFALQDAIKLLNETTLPPDQVIK